MTRATGETRINLQHRTDGLISGRIQVIGWRPADVTMLGHVLSAAALFEEEGVQILDAMRALARPGVVPETDDQVPE